MCYPVGKWIKVASSNCNYIHGTEEGIKFKNNCRSVSFMWLEPELD